MICRPPDHGTICLQLSNDSRLERGVGLAVIDLRCIAEPAQSNLERLGIGTIINETAPNRSVGAAPYTRERIGAPRHDSDQLRFAKAATRSHGGGGFFTGKRLFLSQYRDTG